MTRDEEIQVCKSKVRYNSKKEARTKINWMEQEGHRPKYPLKEYHCSCCEGYHLTSKVPKGSRKEHPLLHPEMFSELIDKQKALSSKE